MGRNMARQHPAERIAVGDRYGRWVVQEVIDRTVLGRSLCKCDCGTVRTVMNRNLLNGRSTSCGCIAAEKAKQRKYPKKHGMTKTRLYHVWVNIKDRCRNKNCEAYKNYGSRGISICEEWLDFSTFHAWAMENGYDPKAKRGQCTIDRIDTNKGYYPENCRWVDLYEQQNNKRNNRRFSYAGELKTIPELSREYGIPANTLWNRVHSGWDIKLAVETPIGAGVSRDNPYTSRCRKIVVVDRNGDVVETYRSVADAAEAYGITKGAVSRSCKTLTPTKLGVAFEYAEGYADNHQNSYTSFHEPRWSGRGICVEMLDLDGNYQMSFPSIRDAANHVNGKTPNLISRCCRGISESAYSHKWRYSAEVVE